MTQLFTNKPINSSLGLLLLRLGLAAFLGWHGFEKLQLAFAGQSSGFPDPLHLGPVVSQWLAVFAEFFCSILLALGLWFRPALLVQLALTFIIATQVHRGKTFTEGEHALLFFIGFICLFFTGPGSYVLGKRH
jgi:putative oxidoreductase